MSVQRWIGFDGKNETHWTSFPLFCILLGKSGRTTIDKELRDAGAEESAKPVVKRCDEQEGESSWMGSWWSVVAL